MDQLLGDAVASSLNRKAPHFSVFSVPIETTRSLFSCIFYIPKPELHPGNIFFPFLQKQGLPRIPLRSVVVRSWSSSRLQRAAARCVRCHEFGRSAAVPMAA